MGEVYLAQDGALDRSVALKILPPDLAAKKDRMERFVREAKAAAALNHPNIAHIYEIGESDGVNFIAMEFVDGDTLRQLIHGRSTDLKKLLRYLQHTAEGLAKAHTAGIVHRDLKPDNIMITRDGHAKILDFGLAKLIEPRLSDGGTEDAATAIMRQQSTPGVIMGTVGYMSPEQAQGKTNGIDQRSDIFSFGCILFEAATGHKAFMGDTMVKSLHKIIYEPAPLLTEFNFGSADLQRIVRRCLAKDPDERYQTIKDVAIELRMRREIEVAVFHLRCFSMSGAAIRCYAATHNPIHLVRGADAFAGAPSTATSLGARPRERCFNG
jgi:serine/threonine protein kinase